MFASNSFDFYRERVFFFVIECCSRHVSLGKIIWFYNNIFRKHNHCCCCNWNYGWCVKYILFFRRIFTLFYTTSVTVRGEGENGNIVWSLLFRDVWVHKYKVFFVKYARLLFLLSAGDVWIYSTNKNSTDSSSALRQYMILCYKKLCMLS